jgi:hypothetical protein
VYVADDGSVQQSPLLAKVPELVERLAKSLMLQQRREDELMALLKRERAWQPMADAPKSEHQSLLLQVGGTARVGHWDFDTSTWRVLGRIVDPTAWHYLPWREVRDE